MTTLEFIKEKNHIIKKYTGITLIPESQMIDIPKTQLNMTADRYACPYCMQFLKFQCKSCPMFDANNDCHDTHSTYHQMCLAIGDKDMVATSSPWFEELKMLINQYNKID